MHYLHCLLKRYKACGNEPKSALALAEKQIKPLDNIKTNETVRIREESKHEMDQVALVTNKKWPERE